MERFTIELSAGDLAPVLDIAGGTGDLAISLPSGWGLRVQ